MSWLSDAWDGISGFVKENKDWIQPVAKVGMGALNQQNIDNTQDTYAQYLREKEMRNYENYVQQAQLYNAGLGQGGGGGGGGGNNAAQMGASKKANRKMQQTYRKILAMYKPYKDAADALLPGMMQSYQSGLGLMGDMTNIVKDPKQMAKLNGSIPAYQVNVPLPESVRIK
jgi:hypothetical protein